MRKLRGFIPTTVLVAVLTLGTTFAHAGILINGSSVASTSDVAVANLGILINGLLGILING